MIGWDIGWVFCFCCFSNVFCGCSLFLCFPACCTVRSTRFAGTNFSKARSVTKGIKQYCIFSRNLAKRHATLSSRNTMVSWRATAYWRIPFQLFKIMLDFPQGILFLFKWQFLGVILHFLTETPPSFKGIATDTYMKRFPLAQDLKQYNNAILFQKDCCASWWLRSPRNATHFW